MASVIFRLRRAVSTLLSRSHIIHGTQTLLLNERKLKCDTVGKLFVVLHVLVPRTGMHLIDSEFATTKKLSQMVIVGLAQF